MREREGKGVPVVGSGGGFGGGWGSGGGFDGGWRWAPVVGSVVGGASVVSGSERDRENERERERMK